MSNRHRRSHLNHSTTWPGSGACQKVVIRRFSYQEFISDIALKLFRQQRKHKYEMEKKNKNFYFISKVSNALHMRSGHSSNNKVDLDRWVHRKKCCKFISHFRFL